MPELPDIILPDDLRPRDGRFGSGPSKVDPEAVAALAAVADGYLGTSHRRSGVRDVVAGVRSGLSDLYDLPDGHEVVLGVGGATAFWDAAAFGLIVERSQHLVFGEFSGKFATVVQGAPHLADPELVESEPGTHPDPVPSDVVDLYALTHNETSTGVAMPVRRPVGGAPDALVAVDATSAAGAIEVQCAEFDVYYFSPQKAFGSEGGLWVAIVSPAAVDRIGSLAASGRWVPPFLSLELALDNSRKDQTYNTPALATLFLLRHQIDRMLGEGGMAWAAGRSRRSSSIVYDWAERSGYATPFVTDAAKRSPTVATIDFSDDIPADTIEAVLRANGIVDTAGYRKLGRNQLRISCFPNIDPDDVATLTAAIDHIAAKL